MTNGPSVAIDKYCFIRRPWAASRQVLFYKKARARPRELRPRGALDKRAVRGHRQALLYKKAMGGHLDKFCFIRTPGVGQGSSAQGGDP